MLVAVYATSANADNYTFTAADGNTYAWTTNTDGTAATLTGLQNTDFSAGMNLPDRVTADNFSKKDSFFSDDNMDDGENTFSDDNKEK